MLSVTCKKEERATAMSSLVDVASAIITAILKQSTYLGPPFLPVFV